MNVMMKWWKKLTKNQKGFSLIELLCTVAIFSIVITSVGTAMVVSARSYQNGSVELDLQQQAQITSNLLTNLIIDSDEVVQASGDTLTVRKVESGENVTYQIYYSGADETIYYISSADATSTPRVLAEYVTGFTVSQDTAGGNVDFALEFTENGRSYKSDYHVTPRNGVSSGGMVTAGTASVFVENRLILEPGQDYDLNVRVLGTSIQGFSVSGITGNAATDTTVTPKDTNTAHIEVGLGETSNSFQFNVQPTDTSIAPQLVTVYVRRVNAINVSGYKVDGTVNKAGAIYKVTAPLSGTNLEKEPGSWYDVDYVDPYTVDWAFEFTREDDAGNSTTPSAGEYIQEISRGMDGNVPYVMFQLTQDMTEGCSLKVTATALHPEGEYPEDSGNKTNKTGLKYGTVQGFWTLDYQAWRRSGRLDIGLGLDDSYFYYNEYTGEVSGFAGNAQVNFWGYSSAIGWTDPTDQTTGFNYYNTGDTNAVISVDFGTPGDPNTWELVLNTHRSQNPSSIMSYSSPYWTFNDDHQSGYWSDVAYYVVKIWYHIYDGIHAGEDVVIEDTYSIEDVAIKFKNAVGANWKRTNEVYVTTSDSLEKYKVYYTFDKGWEEGAAIYFEDLGRFVGVVHDDGNDYNDIRCDITVSEQGNDGLADYIIFSLPSDKKQECITKTAEDGGIIKEIYEYNPLLEYPRNYITNGIIPDWMYTGGYPSQENQDRIKGCDGTVEFHFVEPNISGVTLKTMYCPTPTEFISLGNVYYVGGTDASGNDVKIKIVCNGNVATYQEEVGGVVTNTNLTWNGAGWTAN